MYSIPNRSTLAVMNLKDSEVVQEVILGPGEKRDPRRSPRTGVGGSSPRVASFQG